MTKEVWVCPDSGQTNSLRCADMGCNTCRKHHLMPQREPDDRKRCRAEWSGYRPGRNDGRCNLVRDHDGTPPCRYRLLGLGANGEPERRRTKWSQEAVTTIRDIADTYGLTMMDANAPMEITIKPCDIAGSKANNQTECAIARAVKRQMKAQDVYVLRTTVWVSDGDHLVRYALPLSLQKEVVSFDRHHDFRPGKYHLAKATPLVSGRKAAKRQYNKKKLGRTRKSQLSHKSESVRSSDLENDR